MTLYATVWTARRKALLHDLHGTMPRAELATRLGVTFGALVAHLGREYRAGRMQVPHEELSVSTRNVRRREKRKLATLAPPPPEPAPEPAPEPILDELDFDPLPAFEPPPAVPRGALSRTPPPRPRSCQFPEWPHEEKPGLNPLFCDAILAGDEAPYCAEHRKLTHTKVRQFAPPAWKEPHRV